MPPFPRALLLSSCLVLAVSVTGFTFLGTEVDPPPPASQGISEPTSVTQVPVEVIVDHRQGVMRAVSGNMAASGAILVDGAPFEDRVGFYAASLAELLSDIPSYFPEGTTHAESDARPEVWSNAATFSERAAVTAERAAAFAAATEQGNRAAMAQAFLSLGQSCGACHDDFRF
jgi:cytochrome c556